MKKRILICLCLLCALATIVALASCQEKNRETETTGAESMTQSEPATLPATDAPTEAPTAAVEPATDPAETTPTTAPAETETETEPETEPESETLYDITKPEVMCEMNESYYNVMNYGAVGNGLTDDTAAVRDCLMDAYRHSGVAYFPRGEYLIFETITLPKDDSKVMRVIGDNAVLIGDEMLNGSMLVINMKYNFTMYGMEMEHRGKGSCIDALFLVAKWCRFRATDAESTAHAVVFHGSNCRVIECSFDVASPDVYCLAYIKTLDEISINDHIVDNVFRGSAMGVLVGDGADKSDGRCEGLKINGNYFYNTGAEQIRVTEILHINIAHNVFRDGTGVGIALTQLGHGADGVYINDNDIRMGEGAKACIATIAGGDNYVSSVNINNNLLCGGEYGVLDEVTISRAFVRENRFVGQTVAGYSIGKTIIRNPYYIMDNIIETPEGVPAIQIIGRVAPTVARNVTGPTVDCPDRLVEAVEAGCFMDPAERGENKSRLTPTTTPAHNTYEGEEDIGNEDPAVEEETEPEMNVPIISTQPVEADMFGSEGITGSEAYAVSGDIAMHFAATASFDCITIICPSWSDNIGSFHVELFKWNKNYKTTVAGDPIYVCDWTNFKDNAYNKVQVDPLEAGEYLLRLSIDPDKFSEMVGVWTVTRSSTYMKVYKNGQFCPGLEFYRATIHYTETPETLHWEASKEK